VPRLTARERREGYLREYGYQQKTGKPFFPFAVVHDVIANCFFVFLIIGLACLWYFTAKHGVDINHGGKSGVLGPLWDDATFARLREVQRRVDPDGMFRRAGWRL